MAQDFVKAALTSEIATGEKKLVKVGNIWTLLVNLGGEYYAIDGICSHASTILSRGQLDGDELMCPLHKSVFNVKTGEVLTPPALGNLTVYPVRVDGENILVGPPATPDD